MESGVLVSENTAGIEVPELMAQDIDTEEDLLLAEFKFRFLQRKAQGE
jgi:CMP-N-acetylneuraminic acid synthetase